MDTQSLRPKPGTLVYTLTQTLSGGFATPNIRVGFMNRFGGDAELDLTLKFQATLADAKPDGSLSYYAPSFAMDCEPKNAITAANLLRKLYDKHGKVDRSFADPLLWKLTLGELHAEQCHYDMRLSHVVPIAEVKGPEWISWRDDYVRMGDKNGCHVAAFARDEDEARAEMILYSKEHEGHWLVEKEWFERWKSAGFPVMALRDSSYRYTAPTTWDAIAYRTGKKEAGAA